MVRLRQPKPRPGKKLNNLLVFSLYLLVLTACTHPSAGHKLYDPAAVDFTVACNPLFDNQLYPSLILATDNAQLQTPNSQLQTINFTVTAPADACVLRIMADSSSLNYVTIFQEVLPHRGQTYSFPFSPKWKYDILRHMRQATSVDLTFHCYINDEQVDIENLHVNCRSVNECPLSLKNLDTRWFFAAYVNEDHPAIDQILSTILDQAIVPRFNGYQGTARNVKDQVFAIWYYALNHGISYSSISCTSNATATANVQHIRFFDDVLNTRQANCIDACVFFASIMRKIGLKPVIFVEPCHAYLGYYTDKGRRHLELMETTITSWVNFPQLERALDGDGHLPQDKLEKISKYLSANELQRWNEGRMTFEELKLTVARSLFEKASEYNRETWEANREHFADTANRAYQQLDIERLRGMVQPIR